jgi:HD-GYP domain-containing protein (c-di-GMP phosphodiesterase class II)
MNRVTAIFQSPKSVWQRAHVTTDGALAYWLPATLFLVALAATASLGANFLAQHTNNRHQEVERAVAAMERFANAMAENADRSVAAIDMVLSEMNGGLTLLRDTGSPWQTWSAERGHSFLASRKNAAVPQLRDFAVYDREGWQTFHSTLYPAPRFTIADRPYFKDLAAGADRASYGPYLGRNSGSYTFAIARRLEDTNGAFAGVLFSAIEPDYFRSVCSTLRPDPGMSGLLVNHSDLIIAGCGDAAQPQGALPQGTLGQSASAMVGKGVERSARSDEVPPSPDALEAAPTISYRRDLAGHPEMSVLVIARTADMLAPWRDVNRHLMLLTGGSVATLVFAGLGIVMYASVSVRRKRRIIAGQDATIAAFCAMAEVRDGETGNHIRRTQHFVLALARQLRKHPAFHAALDSETIAMLFKAAPLHDIGKVAIPDAILRKPGKLSPEEWQVMRRHCEYGRNAIDRALADLSGSDAHLLYHARDIAYGHHERWDGKGYPQGLAGTAIPVSARLMAVADVYDALTSRRVYKDAFPHDHAIADMVAGRGSQFDPDIIDAMLAIAEDFRNIAETYRDRSAHTPDAGTPGDQPPP